MTMQTDTRRNRNVLVKGGLLLAVIAPIGFHREWGAIRGYLKASAGYELCVERSELGFVDSEGRIVETRSDAFGLKVGACIKGPYSERFADDSRREESAFTVRWRLNNMEVETSLIEPIGIKLRVVYLPLQVAKEKDPHIVITVINRSGALISIAEGVRNAACIADGKRFRSNTGGHWDGGTQIQPAKGATRSFKLSDFPGVPLSGRHEMSFEILGIRSESETVEWIAA
jgi:hypothetical protein